MQTQKTVLLIMGSVRAGRVCQAIAGWVALVGRGQGSLTCEVVDLADWPLPLDDEPAIPATGKYLRPHTQAWAGKIKSAHAVVFVTPQYNWGYPAALKNAIDHLYAEWQQKPAMIVSYGGHGGTKCAEQLRQVATAVSLQLVATAPALTLPSSVIREGAALEPERDFQTQRPDVERAFAELVEKLSSRTSG